MEFLGHRRSMALQAPIQECTYTFKPLNRAGLGQKSAPFFISCSYWLSSTVQESGHAKDAYFNLVSLSTQLTRKHHESNKNIVSSPRICARTKPCWDSCHFNVLLSTWNKPTYFRQLVNRYKSREPDLGDIRSTRHAIFSAAWRPGAKKLRLGIFSH